MNNRQKAIDIFLAGLESVKPKNLIDRYVSIKKNKLQIGDDFVDLSLVENIYVIGGGKASAAMAQALEAILGKRVVAGQIITKYGHALPLKFIEITEAGHPIPDENGILGTKGILSIVKKAQKDDLIICLISGGGSALLTDVPDRCTLEDLKELNSLLLRTGASIAEINCIRKHLSKVKGGFLSKAAFPATLVSLILSDVIGNPLEAIASGPTAPDPTTFADAISIIDHYNIRDRMPTQLYNVLQDGIDNKREETLKEGDEMLNRTTNLIIGTNILALETAKEKACSFGYISRIVADKLDSDIAIVAEYIIENITRNRNSTHKKTCLLFGGEPVVEVKGRGLGGRNQHLTLIMANMLKGLSGVTMMSGGTDGSDGPTDAAGAVVDSETSQKATLLGLDIEEYIENCDAYHFFKQEGGLIKTGPTQTNVMDLMVVLIE